MLNYFVIRQDHIFQLESLILAQIERWRRALHMQVERESSFGNE